MSLKEGKSFERKIRHTLISISIFCSRALQTFYEIPEGKFRIRKTSAKHGKYGTE